MTRRCSKCNAITPPNDIDACPSCGQRFQRRKNHASLTHQVLNKHANGAKASNFCPYKQLCGEFLKSLSWNDALFDRRFNRCYCEHCYSLTSKDALVEAGSLYVIPRGWCRFGLQIDKVRDDVDHIWREWVVTYHGTSVEAAQSIVAHRQFLIPGDKRIDGVKIAIVPGHIPEKNHIYTSPTIAYSGNPIYCRAESFQSNITNKRYKARIVIQCRQRPGTFKIQPETIGAGTKRICPIIPNDQVEIFTTVRASVVPYGILIHLTEDK